MTFTEHISDRLKRNFPGSRIEIQRDGSHAVRVPIALPAGYSATQTEVLFFAPVGFPSAAPAHFWTDVSLALADGRVPAHTSLQPAPTGEVMRWWLWKPSEWNPNRHDLLTFARQIEEGFRRTLLQNSGV